MLCWFHTQFCIEVELSVCDEFEKEGACDRYGVSVDRGGEYLWKDPQ